MPVFYRRACSPCSSKFKIKLFHRYLEIKLFRRLLKILQPGGFKDWPLPKPSPGVRKLHQSAAAGALDFRRNRKSSDFARSCNGKWCLGVNKDKAKKCWLPEINCSSFLSLDSMHAVSKKRHSFKGQFNKTKEKITNHVSSQ